MTSAAPSSGEGDPSPPGATQAADADAAPADAAPAFSSTVSPEDAGATRRAAFWSVLAWAWWAGFFVWLVDEAVLVAVGGASHPSRFLHGAAAGLFLSLLAATAVGVAVGAVWAISIGAQRSSAVVRRASRWLWDLLWQGAPGDHVRRVGAATGWLTLLPVLAMVSIVSTRAIVLGVARPENIAVIVLAVHVGLVLSAAMLGPFVVAVGRAWASLWFRVPGVGWLVGRTGRFAVVTLCAALLATGAVAYRSRELLSYLPWASIGAVGGGTALATFVAALLARIRAPHRGWRIARRALSLTVVIGCGVAGALLPLRSGVAHDAMSGRVVSGAAGHRLVSLLLDVDGDGQIIGFGGGDCAPFDATRRSGADDIPDNGIDENCDGSDLTVASLTAVDGRWDHPVPASWPEKPTIVLVTIDAFAARMLESLGGKGSVVPNLDALAEKSVLFEHCFSQGPSTRLSFPAMFTSQFDTMIERTLRGRWPFPLPDGNLMLAEILRKSGYATVSVAPDVYFTHGYWKGITQGFDKVDSSPVKSFTSGGRHTAAEVTAAATVALSEPRDDPLFLWVHYYDAHSPHRQPKGGKVFGTERIDVYRSELDFVDRHVGELLEAIREHHPDALVVVAADHGVGFDSPRHDKAGYGHDLSTVVLHVPLLFNAPFLQARRISAPVSTLDITPTLVNLLGLRKSYGFKGHSLVPALATGLATRPPLVFSEYYVPEAKLRGDDPLRLVSVRTPRHNLVLDRTTGTVEAYDWTDDYEERENLWDAELDRLDREELETLKTTLDLFVYATYTNRPRSEAAPPPARKRKAKGAP